MVQGHKQVQNEFFNCKKKELEKNSFETIITIITYFFASHACIHDKKVF
jgi:hypothetical protein